MKRFFAACLMAFSTYAIGFDALEKFTQPGMDISDLWYNPNESGWGMNVIQQSNTSFATLFVYGANNSPVWYVAPAVTYQSYDSANLEFIHSGTLYQTSGPAFSAGSFNPALVGIREVGSLTLRSGLNPLGNTLYRGRLTYTVDGVTVNKAVERQTWRMANHAGTYYGAIRTTWSGCSNASLNGEFNDYGMFTVTQSSATPPELRITFLKDGGGTSLVFGGDYYQGGRNGTIPYGALGLALASGASTSAQGFGLDINSGVSGISGDFSFGSFSGSTFSGCTMVARMAGAK